MRFRDYRRLFLILALCLAAAGCVALLGNYGRIDPSDQVTRDFEEYQVHAKYRYYVTGPHIAPNAILGLDRNYRLDPRTSWREVAMTPFVLKELIQGMRDVVFGKFTDLHGFELRDDRGEPIGVWYSVMQARSFVKMNENGTVWIDTPPLELFQTSEENPLRDHGVGVWSGTR
jgi:hypothetical protein